MESNSFQAQWQKEALQTFKNKRASNKKTRENLLIVFRWNYVKSESQTTAKHKWHKLTFDPNTNSLSYFLEEFNECAEKAFGDDAQHKIDNLLYEKLPHHLKRSPKSFYVENGTYDEFVTHLWR